LRKHVGGPHEAVRRIEGCLSRSSYPASASVLDMQGHALHAPHSLGATFMSKTKLAIVAVGVAALGAAGAGTAFASTHGTAAKAPAAQVAQASTESPDSGTKDAPGGPNVQQGDQNTPDTASSTEKAGSEQASSAEAAGSETAGASDGPGGYADPAGSNANTQQEGEH